MLFYRIEVGYSAESDTPVKSMVLDNINNNVESIYQQCDDSYYIFVSSVKSYKITLGAIINGISFQQDKVKKYLDKIDIEYISLYSEEVTFKSLDALIKISQRNDFVRDYEDIYRYFSLDRLFSIFNRNLFYSENFIQINSSKKELQKINPLYLNETLLEEISRIYKANNAAVKFGHPVHYFIQSDNYYKQNKTIEILLSALYSNKRIYNKRYCTVNIDEFHSYSEVQYKQLFNSNIYGTIVVNFIAGEEKEEESPISGEAIYMMRSFCSIVKNFKNQVLTIFCFTNSSKKIKNFVIENLASTTFVEIKEDVMFGEKAKLYLTELAESNELITDNFLFKNIKSNGKAYTISELDQEFDEWFSNKLKTQIYSQYSEINSISTNIANDKPKGWAFQELENMIGLINAKKTIIQTLNFYKAKKIFRNKGTLSDDPTLHMIFTGNPGTAKTSVARLFAQILKDNGILSVGDLYEVGRADLVEQFVGWTAPNVKSIFKKAKGSVLFIDEAYSLVDDKDGLYGDEAINTIVSEMENMREDIVVIFAGYQEKMETFLQKNPGLRSRIPYHIHFDDYCC